MKGQRFPDGFEEWFNESGPQTGRGSTDFQTFQRTGQFKTPKETVSQFIASVTKAGGPRWSNLTINSPNTSFEGWDFDFSSIEGGQAERITAERTHAWHVTVSGHFDALTVRGLHAWSLNLHPDMSLKPIELHNCVIGRLNLRDRSGQTHKFSLELFNCWIGCLTLSSSCLKSLRITGGGVARIDCPPADGSNPFTGAVMFNKVFFPISAEQTSLFEGPQAYRSLHAHLKKHDNMLMANEMRSYQLRSEQEDELGFAKVTNWVYGTFANYGTNPGRPLWWFLSLYALTFIYILIFDGGTLGQGPEFYVGANAHLLDKCGGWLNRSLLLPLQSIVNPFGIFFDARKIILPTTVAGSALLTIQGLCSDVLLLMTVLSVRRRFKAE